MLQLDSVSVAVRAHYAPVFSRLGPYDRGVLDGAAWSHSARAPRLLVEYWAHEAALMAVDDWPLLRWRMREYTHGRWGTHIVKANPQLVDDVVAAVTDLDRHRGADRGVPGRRTTRAKGPVVGPQRHQVGDRGAVRLRCAHHRDARRLRPPLRPHRTGAAPEVVARVVDDDEAVRELCLRAAGALGVATEADLRDYFRLSAKQAKPAIADLVAKGELEPVVVDGWAAPAYLQAGQTVARVDRGTALLCPFDPLIFFRPRVERLFGFHYRIEIYTPAAKRQYGYYVWPFLLDGRLVGRVDLKAERTRDALHVVGAFAEPGRIGRGSPPRWQWNSRRWRSGSGWPT